MHCGVGTASNRSSTSGSQMAEGIPSENPLKISELKNPKF